MKKIAFTCITILFLFSSELLYCQSDKEKAEKIAYKGIELVDAGKYSEGIKKFEEALVLDPNNIIYLYEIGYAYYLQEDYKKAIEKYEPLLKRNDVIEGVFVSLGNSYDYEKQSQKAMEVYEAGLKKFPKSGKIYLEMGVVTMNNGDSKNALTYFFKGIEVNPSHPSNYYYVSKLNCTGGDQVTGIMFGEAFMNLERNTERTAEISKLIYDTYKKIISFSDGKSPVNIAATSKFGIIFYSVALNLAATLGGETTNDMDALSSIRKTVLDLYIQNFSDKYPNPVLEFQNELLKDELLDAYNHWILMKGSENEFDIWYAKNESTWEKFKTIFGNNPLKLNESNKFPLDDYTSSF